MANFTFLGLGISRNLKEVDSFSLPKRETPGILNGFRGIIGDSEGTILNVDRKDRRNGIDQPDIFEKRPPGTRDNRLLLVPVKVDTVVAEIAPKVKDDPVEEGKGGVDFPPTDELVFLNL